MSLKLGFMDNCKEFDIFEAVAQMVELLPDEKLKSTLLSSGRRYALCEVNNRLRSIERWEDILTKKHKKLREILVREKIMLEPIDKLVQAYCLVLGIE